MHNAPVGMKFHFVDAAPMRWPRRITLASSSSAVGGQQRCDLSPAKGRIQLESHQRGKGPVGLQHNAGAVQRDHARRNRLDDRLQLAPPFLDGQVGRGELRLGSLRQLAAGLEIRMPCD
jgi:hypothetical protein